MIQLIATNVPECERFGNIVRQHARQREQKATHRELQTLSAAYSSNSQIIWLAADALLGMIGEGVGVWQRWKQLQVVEGLLGGVQ